MEFSPHNPVIRRCAEGVSLEEQGHREEAGRLFLQAWNEATHDLERFFAAYFIARQQENIPDRLTWFETALQLALKLNDETVKGAYPALYTHIAGCYAQSGDQANAKKYTGLAAAHPEAISDKGPFYHGTKADLKPGDLLVAGGRSNYQPEIVMNHVYFTASPGGAGLAAMLAKGEGSERVYLVEPTGAFEHDPNVTDKKFPGNPTRSYRTALPLKITGEIEDWSKMSPQELQQWREKLARNTGKIIN